MSAQSLSSHSIDSPDRSDGLTSLVSGGEEFISRIAHDLRTPLAAIKAAIGVVIANEPPGTTDPIRRMLHNIDHAADQMNSLIANASELSRLTTGRDEIHLGPTNLGDVAIRAAKAAEASARRLDQHVDVHVPSAPRPIMADARRVERAVLNMIENAQRFGPRGGAISVSVDQRHDETVISIEDQGPGVAAADRDRVFSGQADGSSRVGLGLPVARVIAELHGGRVWVDDAPGAGAAFHFAVPNRVAAQSDLSGPARGFKDGDS
ncbi:MAG TPA: HAMP domain-containing sensor histidine kinase [Chloroflexota bacterium]|nr:HAMP domain-containing sensor histidine kinase [Chloroflexota bacterium]